MYSLKNKVVVVTGASSGIGKAAAIAFAKEGCRVVISARTKKNLDEAEAEIKKITPDVLSMETDVSKEVDCKRLMEETIKRFGQIDVLVNNAGISMRALFNDTDLSVLKKLMDINFWGTVYCTKYALPEILKNKGVVVGVSSIAGFKGLPGRTGYSASKFAMHGFLESLRIENLKTGIHVLLLCPGYTASNIRNTALNKEGNAQGDTPLDEKKLMSPEAVAQYLLYGIKRKKNTIILTAQGKLVTLLNKFFPKFLDKQVYKTVSKEKDSPFK